MHKTNGILNGIHHLDYLAFAGIPDVYFIKNGLCFKNAKIKVANIIFGFDLKNICRLEDLACVQNTLKIWVAKILVHAKKEGVE